MSYIISLLFNRIEQVNVRSVNSSQSSNSAFIFSHNRKRSSHTEIFSWLRWGFSLLRPLSVCDVFYHMRFWRKVSQIKEKKKNGVTFEGYRFSVLNNCLLKLNQRRWAVLTERIYRLNREPTEQLEVKWNTAEFDPLPSTRRHFLLNLALVSDDCFRAREHNKGQRDWLKVVIVGLSATIWDQAPALFKNK